MKYFAYFFLLALVMNSCVNPFAPGLSENELNALSILTQQRSPEDVLTNFRYAYTFKDSLIYSDLLDSSFIFISKNYSNSPPTDIIWGRDVDIKTTVGLFRHYNVLELNWGAILSQPIDYKPDSLLVAEIKIIFNLTFDGGIEIPTIKGEALFNFRKKYFGSDSTGIWLITRWEDLSSF